MKASINKYEIHYNKELNKSGIEYICVIINFIKKTKKIVVKHNYIIHFKIKVYSFLAVSNNIISIFM